jgi:uncharacterized protein (TIGR03067 family)
MGKYVWLLVAAGLSLGFAPAPLPKPPSGKRDLKKMQGVWAVTTYTVGGKPFGGPDEGLRVEITGDRMRYTRGGKFLTEWTILLDPTRTPKVFDLRGVAGGRTPGMLLRGVYRLDGDTLTICSGLDEKTDRPADLAGTAPGHRLEVLRRLKR